MPYKIYTYTDPYRIAETDFWEEIKSYPHFCAARTLVNGLISVMRDEIVSLMCPLDDIVNEKVFSSWSKDIGVRIQQYSVLTDLYKKWSAANKLGDNYYSALSHNKSAMLDSLRLFIELGVDPTVLDAQNLNMEHRMFVYMLKLLKNVELFKIPAMPSISELKQIVNKQAEDERVEKVRLHDDGTDSEFLQKDLELIDRMIKTTRNWDGMHVVIHGIHQFTPLQLRFIDHLNQLGVEIIFLYNYVPEYKEIYSSWTYIYQQFDAPIHHDQNIKAYVPVGQFQKIGNAIATNMGLLCEEHISRVDQRIRSNYLLYKDERVQAFDNISEYAGYISDKFIDAEESIHEEQPLYEAPHKKKVGTASVLARMDEIVYTANKDVDDLLQVYHPEYARNRHFLAYPIGQFFAALYTLWNPERKEIDIDYSLLRECVNSGILSKYCAEKLLKTLMNAEAILANINTFTEFKELFGIRYRASYQQVVNSQKGAIQFSLRRLNIFNSYKITKEEVDDLFFAVEEINTIAKELFSLSKEDEYYVFKKHFERLEEFVRERKTSLANEEERDLITQLLTRLDVIKLSQNGGKGSFEDLRSGLYFFLKQKEEPVSDWFVKNFEQIDGDVLTSKVQNTYGRKKIYHFACVSDKDMNISVDELLPWPLSELFIEKAYNPKELPFQVYYAALSERSNFLRYALFYGLYFNHCDIKISFVKRYGDNTTDYYELLKIIGMEKEDGTAESELDECNMSTVMQAKTVQSMPYVREQIADIFLCPYKYLLDYVLNPEPIFSGVFLLQKYFENVVIENTWKVIEGKPQDLMEEKIAQYVEQESLKLRGYFSFFRDTEIIDLQRRAENYIKAKVFCPELKGKNVRKYEETHMQLRKTFGDAWFKEDIQDAPSAHPYKSFERLTSREDGKKVYSTHSVPKQEDKELISCMMEYINKSNSNKSHTGTWCTFCANKNICLAPYAESKE